MALIYFSEKVEKRSSSIEGRGLFAIQSIAQGEIVVVKGGTVMTRAVRDSLEETLGPAEIQIADDLFIGPVTPQTREEGMMHLNHSCDPNVGIRGQIIFVAMRDIEKGEELSFDYATGDHDDWDMNCACGTACCRGIVTGHDWKLPELQEKYRGYFSTYLEDKIQRLK
ncbi:MAG: SET domain-containing protein-lysine N-methyltransferase [Sneathiella sp.]|nr:SET domain-containing protein-lysine N-methyltransferase [Sneathiella sp.]